jgi:hypothetical protein
MNQKTHHIQEQLNVVKKQMQNNLEQAIIREEQLNNVEQKSKDLIDQSKRFDEISKEIQRKQKLKFYKNVICILIFLSIIGCIIYLMWRM